MCLSLQLVCMCVCVSLLNWRVRAYLFLSSCCVCVYLSRFSWCVCVCLSLSLQLLPMCLSISLSSAGAYVSVYLFPGHSRACQLSLARTHTCARSQPPSLARALARNLLTPYVRVSHSYSRSLSFRLFPPICYAPMPREKGGGKMQQKVVRSRDVLVHAYRF